MRRRDLLTLACGAALLPLGGGAFAAEASGGPKRLVVVLLRGAVDGLNVVIPYADAAYYEARPGIAIQKPGSGDDAGLDLDGHFALHPALAQDQSSPKPDNTKVNKRDKAKDAVTADQQKENPNDRQLTQQIRKALVADKSLSTYAHNVKVVAQAGTVTLKGPVRSDDEKKTVVAKAEQIAGAGKVTDELSVAPAK